MAAKAINMPAKMPSRSIFHHLRLAFCWPISMVFLAISVGARALELIWMNLVVFKILPPATHYTYVIIIARFCFLCWDFAYDIIKA